MVKAFFRDTNRHVLDFILRLYQSLKYNIHVQLLWSLHDQLFKASWLRFRCGVDMHCLWPQVMWIIQSLEHACLTMRQSGDLPLLSEVCIPDPLVYRILICDIHSYLSVNHNLIQVQQAKTSNLLGTKGTTRWARCYNCPISVNNLEKTPTCVSVPWHLIGGPTISISRSIRF